MQDKFVTLTYSLIRDKNTTMQEKILLMEIQNLHMQKHGCIAGNEHFAELLGVKKESVSRSINALAKKGYITTEIIQGSRNFDRKITINKELRPLNKMLSEGKQNVIDPLTNCSETKDRRRDEEKSIRKNTKKENVTPQESQESKKDEEKILPKDILDFYKENISNLRSKIQEVNSMNALALHKKELALILKGLENYAKVLPEDATYIITLQNFVRNGVYLDYQEEPTTKVFTQKISNNSYKSKRQNFDDLVDEVLGIPGQQRNNDFDLIEGEVI